MKLTKFRGSWYAEDYRGSLTLLYRLLIILVNQSLPHPNLLVNPKGDENSFEIVDVTKRRDVHPFGIDILESGIINIVDIESFEEAKRVYNILIRYGFREDTVIMESTRETVTKLISFFNQGEPQTVH